ncbi:RNA methyltransferase [Haloferax sp. S1W]|uniref:RNA methyltransferase n=1 Tax=Haloferax sp. S1W TaxID=3377110 RepID=UPI0037CB077D
MSDDPVQKSNAGAESDHEFVVVVVEPETPGNVGTIARAMKNFGIYDLRLVNPPPLDPDGEAYGFAGHAREDVLPNATETTLEEVVEEFHTIGTTAVSHEDSTRHVRYPFKTPVEVADSLESVKTKTALVFGREGTGLDNEELRMLDEVCCIPADHRYPVLNLGQAATILMYELRRFTVDEVQLPDVERERASEAEIDVVYRFFDDLLDAIDYREHKRAKTSQMMRRLVGRAHPTEREAATLTGVLRRAAEQIRNPERFRDDD